MLTSLCDEMMTPLIGSKALHLALHAPGWMLTSLLVYGSHTLMVHYA